MHQAEPANPRAIRPVDPGVDRPYWSVMIPTYNCDDLLERTLRAVLGQDPGTDRMQIAVIDDRSPNGRSRSIVERMAPGRVEFFEQPANVGLAENWNTCVVRARGDWVHILHQDDLIAPGFYDRLARADEARPEVGAAFCRYSYIGAGGETLKLAPIERESAGALEGWASKIAVEQRIQCPSIVVRRAAYERLGGFRADLRFSLDWEMWARIAFAYPVWYEPEVLASWRDHAGSETRRLKEAGIVLDDIERGIAIIGGHAPAADRPAILREATARARWWIAPEVDRLMSEGRFAEALGLVNRSWRHEGLAKRAEVWSKYARWALKVWLRGPAGAPAGAGGADRG